MNEENDVLDINTLFGPLPAASADLAVDTLLELMRKHNVRSACTLSTLGILLDPTVGNSATRAACAEHPELMPVATLNPAMYYGDNAAIERLKSEGFRLLRFFPGAQNWKIDYTPFHALVSSLEKVNLPVMISIEAVGEISDLNRALKSCQGAVILSRVDQATLAEAISALRTYPNWHIELSRLLSPGCIKLAADTVGADRLLLGTSAPAQPIASVVNTLRFAGLDAASQKQILGDNARRILNLA